MIPRFLLGLAALLLTAALAENGPAWGAEPRPEQGAVHVITVQQAITPATSSYISRAIDHATAYRAEALIISLDTPGGLLSSTREIVQLILGSPVPVVVFISPSGARGASAGTMLTLASHVAAMAPGTHIGAAHPVSLFGGDDNKVMGEKILNDTSAFVESIAQLRGRNIEWAISSVRDSQSIPEQRALELNVIELVAHDLTDLVRQLDGREVRMSRAETIVLHTVGRPVITVDMTISQSFMSLVSNPNLVFLLLIIGLVGLYIEFSNPGMYFPGIAGAISLILALIALQTLPVSYGALGLMLLGAALLVAESFIPSFGVLGVGGLASLLLGSMFLLDETRTDLRISLPIILSSVATAGVAALVIGRLIVRSFHAPLRSFQPNLVGHAAEAREAIAAGAEGRVFVNGELWRATSQASVAAGAKVTVERTEGLLLHVRPTGGPPAPAESDAAETT